MDLVLLDAMMRGISGPNLLRAEDLRAPRPPFVAMSGYAENHTAAMALVVQSEPEQPSPG